MIHVVEYTMNIFYSELKFIIPEAAIIFFGPPWCPEEVSDMSQKTSQICLAIPFRKCRPEMRSNMFAAAFPKAFGAKRL